MNETLPNITLEKLERGADYPTPYRAHIVGPGYDHHGEAESPGKALLYAVTHWLQHHRNDTNTDTGEGRT